MLMIKSKCMVLSGQLKFVIFSLISSEHNYVFVSLFGEPFDTRQPFSYTIKDYRGKSGLFYLFIYLYLYTVFI